MIYSNNTTESSMATFFDKYLGYWKFFLLSVFVFLLAVFFYLRYMAETQYEITSSILVKSQDEGQGAIKTQSIKELGLIRNTTNVEDEIGILKSIGLMEKVITARALNISFFLEGKIRDVEIYGEDVPVTVLFDETSAEVEYDIPIYFKILPEGKCLIEAVHDNKTFKEKFAFGDLLKTPFGSFTVNENSKSKFEDIGKPLYFMIRDKDEVIDEFLQNLYVELSNLDGNLIDIRFKSINKTKGEDVVAGLIETYVNEMIKHENELAENTIKMIDSRLKLLSGEIEGVEKTVEEFKTINDPDNVTNNAELYIAQANDYKKLIADYQAQIKIVGEIENFLLKGNLNSPIPSTLSLDDLSLTSLIEMYNETLLEKRQISQSAGDSNPLIVKLDETLNQLSLGIIENVRSVKNRLEITQRNLQANANKYQEQIAKVPAMERQLVDISRDKTTKEGLYLYLLQKREEEVLSLAAPVSSTRIVSLPKAGLMPVSPNKKLFYLAGLFLGFIVPFSLINLKDAFDNKVKTSDDITSRVTVPFIGEIATNKGGKNLLSEASMNTPMSELFRLLKFNIDYLKKEENNQTLLVTSTFKGEGKTFIATNLGAILASGGERVVVLSFDLREPHLMESIGMDDSPGLTDFILRGDMQTSEIIKKHQAFDDLFFIGAGAQVGQVGRLILSNRIEELFLYLKKNFDKIIVDTPPVGLISDAYALNKFIDSTIFVVRKSVTKKQDLRTLENIYKDKKLSNPLVLLNDTVPPEAYGYSTY